MKKDSRDSKRLQMLQPYTNTDLCACGIQMPCEGACRKMHTKGGKVECSELYQIHIRTSKKGDKSIIET